MNASKFCALVLLVAVNSSIAQLAQISDDDLGLIVGQAFISVDASSNGDYEYAKINLGLDVEIQSNIDELRLGEFDRDRGADASVVSDQQADVIINNFALGRVDDYDTNNPTIVPFQIKDPYIELAYKTESGVKQIAGFRIGFGSARGDLSGDFKSLTGAMQGLIVGSSRTAYEARGCFQLNFDCIALSIAGDTEIYGVAELVKGATGENRIDGSYVKRAEWLGIPKGESFQTDNALLGPLLPILTSVSNCEAIGLPACFPISNYQSFFVGDRSDSNIDTGGARGVFMSLQAMDVPWRDHANTEGVSYVNTEKGAFMNFAAYDSAGQTRYPFTVDLYGALNGTARTPTCIGQARGC